MNTIARLKRKIGTGLVRLGANVAGVKRKPSMSSYGGAFGKAGFQGGKFDRMTEEWNPGSAGPNRKFKQDGRVLRERARDLYDNNPYARSAVEAYVSNVIECGIIPKPQYKNRRRRHLWLQAWNRWGGITPSSDFECDMTGQSSIYELQQIWLREVILAGGCLQHYVQVERKHGEIPLAIELIPEERFCDTLQWTHGNRKTANRIVNGVELNTNSKPVAYHLWKADPHDELAFGEPLETLRLPVQHCSYGFIKTQTNPYRGHSLLAPVLIWIWALGYYTDNELKNSDLKSNWAYMVKTSLDSMSEFDWNELVDRDSDSGFTDFYGNPLERLQPQTIFRGMPGDEIASVGPNVPGSDALPWLEMIQRSIAVGLGQSYEETFRDYSKGNFSSTRAAANSDRKHYRRMQNFAKKHNCNPTVFRFTQSASLVQKPGFPLPSHLERNPEEWFNIRSQAPGWRSANPKDDSVSNDTNLKNGTTTLMDVWAEKGEDWEEKLEQRALEKKRAEELGLDMVQSETASALLKTEEPEPDTEEGDNAEAQEE